MLSVLNNIWCWLMPFSKPRLKPECELYRLEEGCLASDEGLIATGQQWQADGSDSSFQLRLGRIKPCGWYMVNLHLVAEQGVAIAKLYVDSGLGFNAEECVELQVGRDRLVKRIVYFATPPKRIRLAPSTVAQAFTLQHFSLVKLSTRRARQLMQKKLNCAELPVSLVTCYQQYCDVVNPPQAQQDYQKWLAKHDLATQVTKSPPSTVLAPSDMPRFSLLLATWNSDVRLLRACLDSVLAQSCGNWQLCIADDASTDPAVIELLEQYCAVDARIVLVCRTHNGHISRASNSALSLATGEYIGLIDHDDLLSPYALQLMDEAISSHPSAQLFYSDEDKISRDDQRYSPHFKSDWNRDLFYSHNYITHFTIIRRALVEQVGGFRTGVEGSQDYDLFLRIIALLDDHQIVHVPHVLYHWRAVPGSTALSASQKSYTTSAGLRALRDYFNHNHVEPDVTDMAINNCYRVTWPLPEPAPLVTLIIPTRDRVDLLRRCIDTLRTITDYRQYEVLIINNQSNCLCTLQYLSELDKQHGVKVINYDCDFNYSAMMNLGVANANGSIIGLINNDIEFMHASWLSEMVRQVSRPDIGCVGAKLYYPDGRIQHAGVVLGIGGVAGHSHKYYAGHHHGYHSRLSLVQNYSAVTGAVLLVRKSIYLAVEGFESRLAVAFNDVDFCLKVREAGYRNLWTPFAEMIHHESLSRGSDDSPDKKNRFKYEVEYMREKWGNKLLRDPFYNHNLTQLREDFSLKI